MSIEVMKIPFSISDELFFFGFGFTVGLYTAGAIWFLWWVSQ